MFNPLGERLLAEVPMLTRGLFLSLDDIHLKELRGLKRDLERKSLVDSWEESWSTDDQCDTDKAWKMLFYVLREPIYQKANLRMALGSDFVVQWLTDLVDIGSELFYGPDFHRANWYLLTFVDVRKLPLINAHLASVDQKALKKQFDVCVRNWLADYGTQNDNDTLAYVSHWLDELTFFLRRSAERQRHVLFSAENC